jgi:hypothetical protein
MLREYQYDWLLRTRTQAADAAGQGGTPLDGRRRWMKKRRFGNGLQYCCLIIAVVIFSAISEAHSAGNCYDECDEYCTAIAPNVACYCEKGHIDCNKILKNIQLPAHASIDDDYIYAKYIGNRNQTCNYQSSKCKEKNRTYFKTDQPLVYQLTKFGDNFAVLYSKYTPSQIVTSEESRWNLAVITEDGEVIDDISLTTKLIESRPMIYTDMSVGKDSMVTIDFSYVNTGSHPLGQDFQIRVRFANRKLVVESSQQTRDDNED